MKQYFTYRKIKLMNEEEISLTLAFIRIAKVKAKYPDVYKKYNDIRNKEEADELDCCTVLYMAYLCAYIEENQELMTEEEFLNLIPTNRATVNKLAIELTYPAKN